MKGPLTDIKTAALKLLSYRARSKKEMAEKLQRKGFAGDHIEDVIKLLETAGLINDSALAAELLRYSVERKSLGNKGIRAFLAGRGIDRELIDKTLMTHSPESEENAALEFAERKLKILKRHPPDVIKRRLWGMLQRRGFSSEVVSKTVNSVL
ncbi:MAG: regulatory protein RecX [Nitrospirae bacterium]|nr:regulatory protein RecX [Nitrospirota bacterium]